MPSTMFQLQKAGLEVVLQEARKFTMASRENPLVQSAKDVVASTPILGGGWLCSHSTLSGLASLILICKLCRLIWDLMRSSCLDLTLTRYRILLTIDQLLDMQDRHVHVKDHPSDTRNHLSEARVRFQELTPYLLSKCK
jgi:hypothetical protein